MIKLFAFYAVLLITTSTADETIDQKIEDNDEFVCTHNGITYKPGEQIATPDAPCLDCVCFRDWSGPSSSSCPMITCPWGSYRSKSHCHAETIEGKCCPEIRCSPPHPLTESGFASGKREKVSTDGYNVTTVLDSEVTLYCVGRNNTQYSDEMGTWIMTVNNTAVEIGNTSRVQTAFFEPSTWALYFSKILKEDEGLYICQITGEYPQTTRLLVNSEPRLPVVDPVCNKPAFAEDSVTECQLKWSEHPWYYNTTLRQCIQHTQMCAWGNDNVFGSQSECEEHCWDICYTPAEPGPCKGEIRRYYYDFIADTCLPFLFGGCKGNFNNFKTIQQCEDSCASTKYRSNGEIARMTSAPANTICSGHCPWRDWLHYIHQGCSPIYEKDSCCPVRFDCSNTSKTPETKINSTIRCSFGSKNYSGGELIPLSDSCLQCPCTENFDANSKTGCHPLNCNETVMTEKLTKGCMPIYLDDQKTCCPIDWQCPPTLKTTFRQGGKETLPKAPVEQQCFYGGQGYSMGFELLTGYRKCLTCSCLTPPMFTCLAVECPKPPSATNDTLRCDIKYKYGAQCCPEYNCWSILEDVTKVGFPRTDKEKEVCQLNECAKGYECLVNYTQCYLDDCQRSCKVCPLPRCVGYSKYRTPVNQCPYCEGPKTPEDACEWNPTYCPSLDHCVVSDEHSCAMVGHCEPACRIDEVYATVHLADGETNSR